jgi:hypothetical protein
MLMGSVFGHISIFVQWKYYILILDDMKQNYVSYQLFIFLIPVYQNLFSCFRSEAFGGPNWYCKIKITYLQHKLFSFQGMSASFDWRLKVSLFLFTFKQEFLI